MSKEKEFNGVVDTENFTEDDYDDFLDYLEDLDDLEEDDDIGPDPDLDDDDDDDDSNEVEVFDIIQAPKQKKAVPNIMNGVNINMNDHNGSSVNINKDGISFNISLGSIIDGLSSVNTAVKDARYKSMKRKLKMQKAKNKRK